MLYTSKRWLGILVSFTLTISEYGANEQNLFRSATLDRLVATAITQKIFPGAVIFISYHGNMIYHKAFGRQTYEPTSSPITTETLFDLASLTKPIATTTAAMSLCDQGLLDLEAPVCSYLPEFRNNGKEKICIKHLLTHTSGLAAGATPFPASCTWEQIRTLLAQQKLAYPTELLFTYSDIGFIILQQVIEKITQESLADFCAREIFTPLGMHNTSFNPLSAFPHKEYAPSNPANDPYGRPAGVVNDEKAFVMGGVAGHAGLFSTAHDLARFMTMLLGKDRPLIKQETLHAWTQQQCPFNRGYGWELGRHLSPEAFGHFGWVGTSLWADRDKNLFCIILTNRSYSGDHARTLPLMTKFRVAFHETLLHTLCEANVPIRQESSVCYQI